MKGQFLIGVCVLFALVDGKSLFTDTEEKMEIEGFDILGNVLSGVIKPTPDKPDKQDKLCKDMKDVLRVLSFGKSVLFNLFRVSLKNLVLEIIDEVSPSSGSGSGSGSFIPIPYATTRRSSGSSRPSGGSTGSSKSITFPFL